MQKKKMAKNGKKPVAKKYGGKPKMRMKMGGKRKARIPRTKENSTRPLR